MKRTFAVVALLAALGVLFKLSTKELPERPGSRSAPSLAVATVNPTAADLEAELLARYPRPSDRELAERVLHRYRQTALAIERTDGLRGLTLLDRLDLEAIFLYEKHPNDFRRLSESLSDDAAADLLLHWREYFGLKRADDTDRGILIAEIGRLTPSQRRLASRYPSALPLLLVDPAAVTELLERWSGDPKDLEDALVILDFVSLDRGAADLRAALRTIDDHGIVALDAFRQQGLGGFALASLYGPVLHALGDAMPLDQTLILLRVNSDYVDELLQTHPAETVAGHLRHVAAAGLVEAVGGSPHALRLVVEFGERGELALTQAGADAADVVYDGYSEPTLRNQAVEAMAEHGTMALAMLDKYATDSDFREILRTYGAAIIPPIAVTDSGPETLAYLRSKPKRSFTESVAASVLFLSGDNGQATIKTIKKDGIERVAELNSSELKFYQFLPLYDLLHLGRVVGQGHAPTSSEMTWALVDGCFVVVDALSLVALQPEGVVVAEAARAELRTVTREVVKGVGREAVQEGTESAGRAIARRAVEQGVETSTERLSRWWTVRLAGGTYRVLRRLPEALPRLSVTEIADLGRPLCAKAGFRLSTWAPLRLLKDGQEILLRIPPERGLKYLGAQATQASVGIVAFHKMEEHLASRRPQNRAE
ncbi:hypothetical protein V5E97_07805 [Singulisphaera sp. Ch08]|uniref:DUF3352 domain-containing protein n=1 Tax=Singulisphaera sp. Ch08 TaxID=3120278 RepID=A0AAU7CMR1_9BACT